MSMSKCKDKHGRYVLTYAGHLYLNGREPFELYKAIESLNKDLLLNVYGKFDSSLNPPKTKKFHYGGKVAKQELVAVYAQTDIIVFIDNKDTIQVPGKTLEVLALNKPILFIYYNDDSPTINYFKKFDGVYFVRNTMENIRDSISEIISSRRCTHERDLRDYSWDVLVTKLEPIIIGDHI
jgi:hypothetical protein